MRKALLLLALSLSMVLSATTTVSVDNLKIMLNRDGQTTILAPNGQDESYYWVSLSPDGSQILYSTAHHGTNVCDLNGQLLRSLGRLNAPKWIDDNNVSGMEEHYSETEHDVVDHINYYGCNLTTMKRRVLTKAEANEFIRLENARLAAQEADNQARAAARRSVHTTGLAGLKIYVNPGHGGHDPNDRSCWTIPVPETWTNPLGYWESNSNLVKGLALRDLLQAAGATVIMSRTTNNSGSRDIQYYNYAAGTPEYNAILAGDDRDLSAIAEEANANQVDHFISIHSNALNGLTNYLLLLYHGETGRPTVATSDLMAASTAAIQIQNQLTVWTASAPLLRGDITFYGDSPNDPYAGLGVLRPLTVPGFLSEGSFHDYAPETHRLCNADYCKLEAIRFFQHFHRYFNRELPQTATISGFVKSQNEKVDILGQAKFLYIPGSYDQWLPLNGAKVVLKDSVGQRIDSIITDDWYNGIFAFYDLQPGTYMVEASKPNYRTVVDTVTVAAEEIAAAKIFLKNVRIDVADYEEPEQDAGTLPMDSYEFVADGTHQSSEAVFTRVIYKEGQVVTLGSDGLKLRKWDFSEVRALPLPANVTIADVAFTADGFLVGSTAGNGSLSIYLWDDNLQNPALLFTETGISGNVGNTIVTSGPLWKAKFYTLSGDHLYSIAYNDSTPNRVVTDEGALYTGAASGRLTVTPEGEVYADQLFVPTYFRYAGHSYIVKIVPSEPTGIGFCVEDITNGVTNAQVVSSTYSLNSTVTQGFAIAYVDGYTIHVGVAGQTASAHEYGRWQSVEVPVANIYASEVSFDGTNFHFRLNEDATSVYLSIVKDGENKDGHELGAMSKGVHEVANPFGTQGFDGFAITASTRAVGRPVKISNNDPIFQFYVPRGMAVDRTPTSPYFGRIYVAEAEGGQISEGAPAVARRTSQGVYVISSDFADVTNQGSTAWNGNVSWGSSSLTNYQFGPSHLGVAPSGKVYVPSSVLTSANVYIMDAADPSADFVPIFGGRRNSETGALKADGATVVDPVMACVVQGEGEEEKLFTMSRNCVGTIYTNICQYNIGQADSLPWKQTPSEVLFDDALTSYFENGCGQIAYDQHGGWFMSQYRYSSATTRPALAHITNGVLDYNCGGTISTSNRGAMAVNADGSLLAIARETGVVAVYEVEYNAANVPTLTEKYVIEWGSAGYAIACDFDAAGNLYIVSSSNERLMVYSLPKRVNSYTTRVAYKQEETALPTVREANEVRKIIRDGQVLIIRDGRTFNALGQQVK